MRAPRLALAAACLLPAILAALAAYQAPPPEQSRPVPPLFPLGERLVYAVKWDPPWYLFFLPTMEAGEVDVRLDGETEYNGKKAIKILFQAHSSGALAKVSGMKIDDEFVFFTDPKTFCSFGASKKIREGKRKRQIDIHYLQDTHQLRIRDTDESVTPPVLKKDEIKDNIPPCVRDPLSAVYFYRTSQLKVGDVQTIMIGHDDRTKEVNTRVENRESIQIPTGTYAAWRVTTTALMGGLFKEGGQFRLWFSADERKVPLQFEFKVRLGKVLGKLKLVQRPQGDAKS